MDAQMLSHERLSRGIHSHERLVANLVGVIFVLITNNRAGKRLFFKTVRLLSY